MGVGGLGMRGRGGSGRLRGGGQGCVHRKWWRFSKQAVVWIPSRVCVILRVCVCVCGFTGETFPAGPTLFPYLLPTILWDGTDPSLPRGRADLFG